VATLLPTHTCIVFHRNICFAVPACTLTCLPLQLCGRLRSGQLLAVELLMTPDDPADFLSEAQLQEVRWQCLRLLSDGDG
jgi:uncharacterized membrane protein